jgi:hypothetical protein
MSEAENRPHSINRAVYNFLTVMAQHGDQKAVEALQRAADLDLLDLMGIDPDTENEEAAFVVELPDGIRIITDHGSTLIPNFEELE